MERSCWCDGRDNTFRSPDGKVYLVFTRTNVDSLRMRVVRKVSAVTVQEEIINYLDRNHLCKLGHAPQDVECHRPCSNV